MTTNKLLSAVALSFGLLAAGSAVAGPTCTTAPKSEWLSEEAMKQKIAAMGYQNIKEFKATKGSCYEIYGYDKDGKKAEVYFHPVTGAIVEAK